MDIPGIFGHKGVLFPRGLPAVNALSFRGSAQPLLHLQNFILSSSSQTSL